MIKKILKKLYHQLRRIQISRRMLLKYKHFTIIANNCWGDNLSGIGNEI